VNEFDYFTLLSWKVVIVILAIYNGWVALIRICISTFVMSNKYGAIITVYEESTCFTRIRMKTAWYLILKCERRTEHKKSSLAGYKELPFDDYS
ncbi:putative transposable element encoded protein, partial [Trachipleistophora hominis]